MTSPLSFLFGKKVKSSHYSTVKFNRISRKQRSGISPVIATTIILAITVVLGLALWVYANSGVSNASIQYSEAIEDYGNIVRNHRFVIANLDFDAENEKMIFWVYNNGKIDATISQDHILVICKDGCYSPTPDSSTLCQHDNPTVPDECNPFYNVPPKELRKFAVSMKPATNPLDDPIMSGSTYEVTIVSDEGLAQTYVKRSD